MYSELLKTPTTTTGTAIQPNSLLEYLYTYFTVAQLKDLLENFPSAESLAHWNVSPKQYESQVHIAIGYVLQD